MLLKPGSNETDNEPFIRMLSQDGDFEAFCGLPYSDKYLEMFVDYFEHKENDQCLYSLYLKEDDAFIGYVGFHREIDDYELEFEEKLYATTLPNNVAANSLLENLGFNAISSEGAVLVAQGIYDEESDDFHAFPNYLW